jgi:hypothetical protein
MGYIPGTAYPPEPPARPSAVTAIAIIGLVIGGLGLLFMPLNIMSAVTAGRPAGPAGPAMWANPAFRTHMLVALPISAVACVLYIVAGVGMLQLRPWARKLAVGLVIFAMLFSLANVLMTLPQTGAAVEAAMQSMPTPPSGPMPNMSFIKPLIYVIAGFTILIGLAVKVTFLILLTRRYVVEAFEANR